MNEFELIMNKALLSNDSKALFIQFCAQKGMAIFMHEEVLRMEHISITLNEIKILENTWIDLLKGEIIGLLGLNDSGKSMMMSVLEGYNPTYTGDIFIDEKLVTVSSYSVAKSLGIVFIQQSLSLISDFTVSESLFLAREKHQNLIVNSKLRKEKARKILSDLNIQVEEDLLIYQLPYYKKFFVEICRAVVNKAKIIIIDGILSGFSKENIEEVKNIFSMLSKRGISVILLDHRLKPIMELCERIFVLRQGRTVGVSTRCCFSENTIFSQMIGFLSTEPVAKKIEMPYQILPNIHLEFRNIFCEDLLNDISFKIHSREILGIINVDDPFGSIIPNILLGKILPESGSIFIDEKPFDVSDRKDPLISDIGFVIDPFYVFEELSIKENIVMPIMKKKSNSFGILNLSELKYLADELISEYIPSNDIKTLMNSRWKINGKIMKKIYLCKALAKDPKCVIFTNPTQYVDIASKKDIYRDIVSLKQKGKSALIISLSFDDLVSVCDRIIVIKNGSLKESFSFSEISENTFVEKYGKYLSQS